MGMTGLLDALVAHFTAQEDALNALDAAAGDGDHGTTLLRGLRAAQADPARAQAAFRTAAGGASGSLWAQVLGAMLAAERGEPLAPALARAADRIAQVGGAAPGDRTMLDALIPASLADDPAAAARAGAEATRAMPARRGRARYVEGAGLGHADAGAASVAMALAVLRGAG
jgi:dihydroxyacetone kinase-like protein